jgi:8-oxo-dGTP pyrophosphatase MutT (NUDIX family)
MGEREGPASLYNPARMVLLESLRQHQPEDAAERASLSEIVAFVESAGVRDPFDREHPGAHLTGSAFVLSADGSRVLLLHHAKLGRWLQPGGHAEPGEARGEEVALREALEETGIPSLQLHPAAPRPFDVDVHVIPERKGEPAHKHLDLRYLVRAPENAPLSPGEGESRQVEWFGWEALPGLGLDDGLRRALAKAKRLVP